MFDMVLK